MQVFFIRIYNKIILSVNGARRRPRLRATVEPTDATNKNLSWSSSDSTVAAVAQTGKVTAKAEGTATITVTTEDGDFTADCLVTVASNEPDEPDKPDQPGPDDPDGPTQPSTKTKFSNINNYFVFDVAADKVITGKVLVIALYGENGALLDLVNVPQTRELTDAYVVMKANPAAKTAKILLWNDVVTALPDAPCEVIEL